MNNISHRFRWSDGLNGWIFKIGQKCLSVRRLKWASLFRKVWWYTCIGRWVRLDRRFRWVRRILSVRCFRGLDEWDGSKVKYSWNSMPSLEGENIYLLVTFTCLYLQLAESPFQVHLQPEDRLEWPAWSMENRICRELFTGGMWSEYSLLLYKHNKYQVLSSCDSDPFTNLRLA